MLTKAAKTIANKLSEKQADALCDAAAFDCLRRCDNHSRSTLAALVRRGLIVGTGSGWYSLTPVGVAVARAAQARFS